MYYRLLKRFRTEQLEKDLYNHHVMITTDSLLHAFHYSYKSILESIEVQILFPKSKRLFANLYELMKHTFIPHRFSAYQIQNSHSNELIPSNEFRPLGLLEQGLVDLDFYITLSFSLIVDKVEQVFFPSNAHDVQYLFDLIHRRSGSEFSSSCCLFTIFGEKRFFEFKRYQPNWYYIRDYMNNYFKLISWCGNTHLDLTNLRQFTLMLLLWLLICESNSLDKEYTQIEHCFTTMIGPADSVNCEGITRFLFDYFGLEQNEISLNKLGDKLYTTLTLPDGEKVVREMQNYALNKKLGLNYIANSTLKSTQDGIGYEESFTFCLFGQKFTVDSFIFSNVTFDRLSDSEGTRLLPRIIPTVLDLAYAIFGAENVAENFIRNTDPYFDVVLPKLRELRSSLQQLESCMMPSSIHNLWLQTIQSLSSFTSDDLFSSCQNYEFKTPITQFASYSHLKYDSSLFAKQHIETDIEPMLLKEVFDIDTEASEFKNIQFLVDGNVQFFNKFLSLLRFLHDLLKSDEMFSKMPISEEATLFYDNFIKTIQTLMNIHQKQCQNQSLSQQETAFLSNIIFAEKDTLNINQRPESLRQTFGDATTSQNYKVFGWYPNLFFKRDDAGRFKPIVIDIHRYPDVDNGAILWEAVGACQLLEYVDHESGLKFYGPMFTQYEFVTPYSTTLNNATWKTKLKNPKLECNSWMSSLSSDACLGANFIGYSRLDHFTCAEYTTQSQTPSFNSSPNSPSPQSMQ